MAATADPDGMVVLAWVGPDEFDGSRGIKSALTRVGWVPLAAKGEHEDRLRAPELRAQLQNQATEHGTRMQLCRFKFDGVIETVEPE